jgi:hypothetical protein
MSDQHQFTLHDAEILWGSRFTTIAGFTLILYDTLLTLGVEVSLLFILSRLISFFLFRMTRVYLRLRLRDRVLTTVGSIFPGEISLEQALDTLYQVHILDQQILDDLYHVHDSLSCVLFQNPSLATG